MLPSCLHVRLNTAGIQTPMFVLDIELLMDIQVMRLMYVMEGCNVPRNQIADLRPQEPLPARRAKASATSTAAAAALIKGNHQH